MNEQNAKAKRSKRTACSARVGYFGLGGITPPAPCKRRAVVVESYEVAPSKFTAGGSYRNTYCAHHATRDAAKYNVSVETL